VEHSWWRFPPSSPPASGSICLQWQGAVIMRCAPRGGLGYNSQPSTCPWCHHHRVSAVCVPCDCPVVRRELIWMWQPNQRPSGSRSESPKHSSGMTRYATGCGIVTRSMSACASQFLPQVRRLWAALPRDGFAFQREGSYCFHISIVPRDA
jgi:hypothetical protein